MAINTLARLPLKSCGGRVQVRDLIHMSSRRLCPQARPHECWAHHTRRRDRTDGTERLIHCLTDPEAPPMYDHVQKTCHTRQHLLVNTETCHVCCLGSTSEGKASDKGLATACIQEKGFQGCCLQDVTIVRPKKIPPGGELTPPEQATPCRMSSVSIHMEHAIGGVKRDRMVKDSICLLNDILRDTVIKTCCGLHHFRLQRTVWPYALINIESTY